MQKTFRYDNRPYNPLSAIEEPPELNYIPADCLREEKTKGLRRLYKPRSKEKALVEAQIVKVWNTFSTELQRYPFGICGFFLYDMRECRGIYAKCDGMCAIYYREKRALIGIDISAISAGADYLTFLLLHEIAHAAAGDGGHSAHYHAYLDRMIMTYNNLNGTAIKNDYFSFNDE